MKIINKLTLEYLKKNRNRSKVTIVGITIVTVFIITIFTLISSYQEYMINIVRSKKNWEAEFSNITYEDSLKIAENDNVKEISMNYDIGVSEENYSLADIVEVRVHIMAYDNNAIKNSFIELEEGRYPENSHEIIVKPRENVQYPELDIFKVLGNQIKCTINGKIKNYTIVGIAKENFGFENNYFSQQEIGAITYLDNDIKTNNLVLNATVLTNNIQKIYKTADNLASVLNIQKIIKEEKELSEAERIQEMMSKKHIADKQISTLTYNNELLNYACVVAEENTEFAKAILIVRGYCC